MTWPVVAIDLRPTEPGSSHWSIMLAACVVTSALLPTPARSQTAWDRVPAGTVVRVQTASFRIEGKLQRFSGDSLFLLRSRSPSTPDPAYFIALRQDILRLSHRQGTSAARGFAFGSLTGLAAGIAVGAIAGPHLASESDLTAADWTKVLALVGVLTGAGIGAVIGAAKPRWRQIE